MAYPLAGFVTWGMASCGTGYKNGGGRDPGVSEGSAEMALVTDSVSLVSVHSSTDV